jgi:hypothetical protein
MLEKTPRPLIYLALKNLVLWARSEFSGSARKITAKV